MTLIVHIYTICVAAAVLIAAMPAYAQTPDKCAIDDRACVLNQIERFAGEIENNAWRDQTYRELAKTLAFEGKLDEAIAVIDHINSPDTQAMTIRGIGMVLAENEGLHPLMEEGFPKLRTRAETIDHPASYAIALTYIAMAQAFAGDDEGAWSTAADMENDALRHKAYGETAEIQAEQGKFDQAMASIGYIDSLAFRNKAYHTVSKILAEQGHLKQAYEAAMKIDNPYKKAEALQYVLDTQKPREQERE